MRVEERTLWRIASVLVVALWLALVVRLMIADVWDETNGMLAFSAPTPLAQKVQFVLTSSLGFWRPLPTLVVTVVLHFVRDFDVSWRVLRGMNALMLLATLATLLRIVQREGTDRRAHALFALAYLSSASTIIAAGWYANVFDVTALLLIAIALSLLFRRRAFAAGVVLGVAFFCKETAALALPFLLVLFAAGRIPFRHALAAGTPAAILGAVYFAIRSKVVPFGGAGDVHGFNPAQFLPTVVNLAESFWEQTLEAYSAIGYVFLILSLLALRRARLIAAMLVFLLATVVIYWGMFDLHQNGTLMDSLHFVGRLYLVPVMLFLFLLAIERRTVTMAILLLPIVYGGAVTARDHIRFQLTYRQIYRRAPVTVHFRMKPLDDTVRGVRIGDIPDAPLRIGPRGLEPR